MALRANRVQACSRELTVNSAPLTKTGSEGRSRLMGRKLSYYLIALLRTVHLKYRLANFVCSLLPDGASAPLRTRLYRLAGFKIEHGAFIMSNLRLVSGLEGFYDKLTIGRGVVSGAKATINLDAEVWLGKNVSLGPNVIIYTGTHPLGPGSQRRLSEVVAKPVRIEDGCWIGLAAIILPGVTIGQGSVVAAGAVVMEDVPPNSYVEGNPARVVRQLPWGDR